jgi:hypothetical protein
VRTGFTPIASPYTALRPNSPLKTVTITQVANNKLAVVDGGGASSAPASSAPARLRWLDRAGLAALHQSYCGEGEALQLGGGAELAGDGVQAPVYFLGEDRWEPSSAAMALFQLVDTGLIVWCMQWLTFCRSLHSGFGGIVPPRRFHRPHVRGRR